MEDQSTRKITLKDFSKICRFCMNQSPVLKTIFKDETLDSELSIVKMFMECLNFDIDESAQLPLFICTECIEKLFNSYQFREQCIDSCNRLTEICQKEKKTEDSSGEGDVDIAKVFRYESDIKIENIDSDDATPLDMNENSHGDYDELTTKEISRKNAKGKLTSSTSKNSTKVKKKVGRPKKPISEKIVKAPEMCQICGGLYVGLKYHMFVHDDTPKFECDYCGRKFKHKSNVFAHVRIHANDRKHQCPHCPYKFQDRAKFLRHLKIHTGERNHRCDLCEKAFCRKTDMLKHRLIHDVPRVPCPYCEKMFTTKTNLLSHVGIHTGERNFKCGICGAAFVASSSLSNHRKIHKKENPIIQCKECGIVLQDTAMLKNHMRDHQKVVMLE